MSGARLIISPTELRRAVNEWLGEDISSFDIGAAVVGDRVGRAVFYLKSDAVVAGFPFAEAIFSELGCKVEWTVEEGVRLPGSGKNRVVIGHVTGPIYRLLQGERTALEALTRASACASYARKCQDAALAGSPDWKGRVAATRKTTPGYFRLVEKYGAIIGGVDPHRYNLSSMVMLKDNHIDAAGSITQAVQQSRKLCGFSTKIEVECRSEGDAVEACRAGADVVMLDNFAPAVTKVVAPRLKGDFPSVTVEVSGGITLDTISHFANPGVDIISIGKITHGPPPIDISLKLVVASKL